MSKWILLLSVGILGAADWDTRASATYLDGRQKEWFAWPVANAKGTPCMSCHTGLTYLLARPMLRRTLGEAAPTEWETGLLASMRTRIDGPATGVAGSVEAVLAAFTLVSADPTSAAARKALDRMWGVQKNGAWAWYSLDLDPWEVKESAYFGAALAAVAVGMAPESYRAEVRDKIMELRTYLASNYAGQPLHNRLAVLWASGKLPAVLGAAERKALLEEIAHKQENDGGWRMETLGPFGVHAAAPVATGGSNAYATAFTGFVLGQARVATGDKTLARAKAWLRTHQTNGVWTAESMNKKYPAGSNQIRFMQDAATAYAVMALLETN